MDSSADILCIYLWIEHGVTVILQFIHAREIDEKKGNFSPADPSGSRFLVSKLIMCSAAAFNEQLATAAPRNGRVENCTSDNGGGSGKQISKLEWSADGGLRCHLQRSGSVKAQQGTRDLLLRCDSSSDSASNGSVSG